VHFQIYNLDSVISNSKMAIAIQKQKAVMDVMLLSQTASDDRLQASHRMP